MAKRTYHLELHQEGMGYLERAGLAGLYMSLAAAEEWADKGNQQAKDLVDDLDWELSPREVEIAWEGEDKVQLGRIVRWAWQSHEKVFFLPAIHRTRDEYEHRYLRLNVHNGLLHSFMQHNLVMPREKEATTETVRLGEDETLSLRFKPLAQKKSDNAITPPQHRTIKKIVGKDVNRSGETGELPSWFYPGAAKRFGRKGEKNWQGPRKIAFALLFAPLGCFYLELPSNTIKNRPYENWATIIPDITDLRRYEKGYLRARHHLHERHSRVRTLGLGDAALRFAASYAGRRLNRLLEVPTITVVAMGCVGHYNTGQQVRKRYLSTHPDKANVRRYELVIRHFAETLRSLREPNEDGSTHFVAVPTPRGRIADSLVQGMPWYRDLAVFPDWQRDKLERRRKQTEKSVSLERLWFAQLQRERSSLMALSQEDEMWEDPQAQKALEIFHAALRQLLNREERALKRGGARGLHDRWDDKVEELRRSISRSKTRIQVRGTLMDILAEAGGTKKLTEDRASFWNLLNHPHEWEKARDLALLSLVTFTDHRLGRTDNDSDAAEETDE